MKRFLVPIFLLIPAFFVLAEKFEFKYVKGDKFRVLSTVQEDVFFNNNLALRTDIFNRIAFSVAEERNGGAGYIAGTFETSERERGAPSSYVLSKHYDSEFQRDKFGVFSIADRYFMPVVRNVPVFPDRDVKPGDTWTAPGEEKHDFRDTYGILEPYKIPFEARYRYIGPKSVDGKILHEISVSYTVFYIPSRPSSFISDYPSRIMGTSDQLVLFDNELGMPVSYRERFRIIIDLFTGLSVEFSGVAESKVIEAGLMDRNKVADEVKKKVEELKLDSVEVRKTPEGVVISVENIQFLPESAVLTESEKKKLDLIASILKNYPDRDILVSGHTALAGTQEGRQKLSENRAKTVADFLISTGAKKPENVTVRGFGATIPIADNSTESGMSRNRRVEITILEN